MAATTTQAGSARSRAALAAAAAFACLVGGVIALGSAGEADGARAVEIGKVSKSPKPSCPTPGGDPPPRRECQVFGEVTGFQVRAHGKKGLMKVPDDGSIVGWSVDLARPNKSEQDFFERVLGDKAFNGRPSARIAMLSKARRKKFRLRAQSPQVQLGSVLGRRQYFTLNNPLEVKKGWIAAISTKTWVPALAHDLPGDLRWKASRESGRCSSFADLTKHSHPHTRIGTTKRYACNYEARLLYWAYLVKD
jgi:hypothetical protein